MRLRSYGPSGLPSRLCFLEKPGAHLDSMSTKLVRRSLFARHYVKPCGLAELPEKLSGFALAPEKLLVSEMRPTSGLRPTVVLFRSRPVFLAAIFCPWLAASCRPALVSHACIRRRARSLRPCDAPALIAPQFRKSGTVATPSASPQLPLFRNCSATIAFLVAFPVAFLDGPCFMVAFSLSSVFIARFSEHTELFHLHFTTHIKL